MADLDLTNTTAVEFIEEVAMFSPHPDTRNLAAQWLEQHDIWVKQGPLPDSNAEYARRDAEDSRLGSKRQSPIDMGPGPHVGTDDGGEYC